MEFSVKGVKVRISFLFWSLICFVTVFDNSLFTLIMLLSIVLHESCHLFAMFVVKIEVKSVNFDPFGIIIERDDGEAEKRQLLIVYSAGIIGNLTVSFLFTILSHIWHIECFNDCVYINLCLAVFNSLPVSGLDGGDIVKTLLQNRVKNSNKIIKLCNIVTILILIVICIIICIKYTINITLIFTILSLGFIGIYKMLC